MLKKENKLIIGLVIALFFLFGCSGNNVVEVQGDYREPVVGFPTYTATLNGNEEAVSIYKHVENIDGKDVLVPNDYFVYKNQRKQLTVYEKIEEIDGKKYVMPKEYNLEMVDGQLMYKEQEPIVRVDAAGNEQMVYIII